MFKNKQYEINGSQFIYKYSTFNHSCNQIMYCFFHVNKHNTHSILENELHKYPQLQSLEITQ